MRIQRDDVYDAELIVIGDTFLPYDFNNWRECCNFLIDKCYGMKRGMTLVNRDKEHLEMRCPLTGEYLTILSSPENLEKIHNQFIIQNLYRRDRHSSSYPKP